MTPPLRIRQVLVIAPVLGLLAAAVALLGHGGADHAGSHGARPATHRKKPKSHHRKQHGPRVFYISYASGRDSNSGRSERSAWRRAPGMVGFSGHYVHRAGDHFVFEGGVTWPNSVFPLAVAASGVPGKDDYYGVDKQWHTGARFSRPVFDAQDEPISGPDPDSLDYSSAGDNDVFIDLRGHDYVTIDGIELTGFTALGSRRNYAYGNCAMIESSSLGSDNDQHITIDGIYAHNMHVDRTDGYGTGACFVVQGYTNHPPYSGSSVLENSTIAGDGRTYGYAVWGYANIIDDDIHGLGELLILAGHGRVSGNHLYDCGYPSFPTLGGSISNTHNNALETVQSDGRFYIFNNVIDDTGYNGALHDECESMFIGTGEETDYVWNNVIFNDHGNSLDLDESHEPRAAFFWNNTLEGGLGNSEPCIEEGHPGTEPLIVLENNLCVTNAGRLESGLSAGKLMVTHNRVLTVRQARREGYLTDGVFAFQPGKRKHALTGGGVNLRDLCRGVLASLCQGTTYGGSLTALTRPLSGSWGIGAYL